MTIAELDIQQATSTRMCVTAGCINEARGGHRNPLGQWCDGCGRREARRRSQLRTARLEERKTDRPGVTPVTPLARRLLAAARDVDRAAEAVYQARQKQQHAEQQLRQAASDLVRELQRRAAA